MISSKTWPVFLLALVSVSALAADARERGFIRKGMGEGEVALKIGKPTMRPSTVTPGANPKRRPGPTSLTLGPLRR